MGGNGAVEVFFPLEINQIGVRSGGVSILKVLVAVSFSYVGSCVVNCGSSAWSGMGSIVSWSGTKYDFS
jgi:hypothetical protein